MARGLHRQGPTLDRFPPPSPMKITAARVIVCCPGRNFVTLKIETDQGPHRPGRRHAQRPRAGGGELPTDHVVPPDRPRRPPDRGHLAVPLPRRLLAARAGDHERHRRRRHRAVGTSRPRRPGCRSLPAARRRQPQRRDGLRPCQRPRHRADRRGVQRYNRMATEAIRAQSGVPGLERSTAWAGGSDVLRAGRCRPAQRARLVDREIPAPHAAAVRGGGARRRPWVHLLHDVHHRLTPIEAARLGRIWSRSACSGWKTPRRPRTRRLSASSASTRPRRWRWARCSTPWDCKDLIQNQLIDYIRATVVHAGGITHLRRIADLAALYQVRTGSHGATDLSPVCMGAALHFDLWVPNFGIQGTCATATRRMRYSRMPTPSGRLHAPGEVPGHGVEIDGRWRRKCLPAPTCRR